MVPTYQGDIQTVSHSIQFPAHAGAQKEGAGNPLPTIILFSPPLDSQEMEDDRGEVKGLRGGHITPGDGVGVEVGVGAGWPHHPPMPGAAGSNCPRTQLTC